MTWVASLPGQRFSTRSHWVRRFNRISSWINGIFFRGFITHDGSMVLEYESQHLPHKSPSFVGKNTIHIPYMDPVGSGFIMFFYEISGMVSPSKEWEVLGLLIWQLMNIGISGVFFQSLLSIGKTHVRKHQSDYRFDGFVEWKMKDVYNLVQMYYFLPHIIEKAICFERFQSTNALPPKIFDAKKVHGVFLPRYHVVWWRSKQPETGPWRINRNGGFDSQDMGPHHQEMRGARQFNQQIGAGRNEFLKLSPQL